jgi:hypothetical protein
MVEELSDLSNSANLLSRRIFLLLLATIHHK